MKFGGAWFVLLLAAALRAVWVCSGGSEEEQAAHPGRLPHRHLPDPA